MWRNAMQCIYVMSCHVMSCYVMSCHVMCCDVTQCNAIYIYIPGYSLVTNFFPGQILVWFLTIFWRFTHFKIKMTISRKNMPLHVFIFESWWICPGISALFPGISAFFPGISAQKNRHIFTQSRVRSAQKARNPKLTTIIKKWPFPAPSQEIRPKGRNLGNGHLFVSFRRSRYIYSMAFSTWKNRLIWSSCKNNLWETRTVRCSQCRDSKCNSWRNLMPSNQYEYYIACMEPVWTPWWHLNPQLTQKRWYFTSTCGVHFSMFLGTLRV